MRNGMKQLGLGLGVLFALGTSSAALAFPPQCDTVCSCSSTCTQTCYEGTLPSNCGAGWTCGCAGVKDAAQASLSQVSTTQKDQEPQQSQELKDAQEQQDASQDVCKAPA